MAEEIKGCPFCGGNEISHGWSAPGLDGSATTGEVQCHTCDALLWKETEAEAIAAWNTHTPAVSEEAVERVAIRRDVFDFLMGTGALGGYYFGESRPDMRGAFWWRTIMRATLSPTTPTEEPQS